MRANLYRHPHTTHQPLLAPLRSLRVKWIVSTIKRFLIAPLTGSRKTPTPLVEHSPIKTGE